MSAKETPPSERVVETAMAQVLAAESAARASVVSATLEAQLIGERSRAAVRDLAERTQRRIHHLRAGFERAADAEMAALQLRDQARARPDEPGADEAARIERAVYRLAAQLTGSAP